MSEEDARKRGGVGHDLTHIRPGGSPVKNSALTSTGVVPFMERYSNSTREVAQDGRRGALMLSIGIKHPDSEHFINAKMESGKVTGANVSVKLDDDFMRAVKEGTTYIQQYPVKSDNPTTIKEINAIDLWNKIVHNAWSSAERLPQPMFGFQCPASGRHPMRVQCRRSPKQPAGIKRFDESLNRKDSLEA